MSNVDGGCDPLYLARIVRIASEDIGNADPRALEISLNAWNAQERLVLRGRSVWLKLLFIWLLRQK